MYRTPRLAWKSYKDYPIKEKMVSMVNIIKQEIVPNSYVANATCHFDEHSPHLHIVGVPVKENCKTGLYKQVRKTSIFTKESLIVIQNIIDRLFNQCNIDLKYFKQQYDPEVKEKERKIFESRIISNLFNKKINKSLKHINDEMEKSAEEFYSNKKEKDDDLS